MLPLSKFRESRVRVEESRSRRVPTDFFFFFFLSCLSSLLFLSTIFPFVSAFLVHFSSWKIKGRPELNQRRSGSKKKEEKKMEKKEEEEEVDKNHATSPRLLTPAGVSSLSLSFVTWPRFFFTSRSPTFLPLWMVFRVCVCVSVAVGNERKRRLLFAFGTFLLLLFLLAPSFHHVASFLPSFLPLPSLPFCDSSVGRADWRWPRPRRLAAPPPTPSLTQSLVVHRPARCVSCGCCCFGCCFCAVVSHSFFSFSPRRLFFFSSSCVNVCVWLLVLVCCASAFAIKERGTTTTTTDYPRRMIDAHLDRLRRQDWPTDKQPQRCPAIFGISFPFFTCPLPIIASIAAAQAPNSNKIVSHRVVPNVTFLLLRHISRFPTFSF